MRLPFICIAVLLILSACTGPAAPVPTATLVPPTATLLPLPVDTATPESTATPAAPAATTAPDATATPAATATHGPTATLSTDAWQTMPVLPETVSERVRLIYQMGLLKGNNPHAFSKVGDCNSTMPYFLGDFDTPDGYDLGEYSDLQETITYFSGSFSRKSMASKDGLTAHAVLSTLWVDWNECETYETPLTCEFRNQRPMYAILSFGTNDANGGVDFEIAMRKVIDMTIGNGTIPILATKADNAEGDNSINQTIAKLAYEYELPLWNYWAAVQPLDDHGLRSPEHLSVSPVGYSNFTEEHLGYGWSIRNLTALQVLDLVHRAVEQPAP